MSISQRITVNAVGDIGLMGKIGESIKANGPLHPFALTADRLKTADIVFGNLEIPFCSSDFSDHFSHNSKNGFANPSAVDCLVHAGFNVMSLANNHIMDCGPAGVTDTISALDKAGIRRTGAGINETQARQPAIIVIRGIKTALLAYAMKGEHSAGPDRAGAATINKDSILEDITKAKGSADFIIVSLHFGMIYTDFPTSAQRELARAVIDAGASLVLGHHPHVLQSIEEYGGGIIAYSLGEFIFDAEFGNVYAKIARDKRKESIILHASISADAPAHCELTPVKLNPALQPEIQESSSGAAILDRLKKLSLATSDDDSMVYRNAGTELVGYQFQVLWFHVKKLNLAYICKQLVRIRPRHLRFLTGFFKTRRVRN